MSAEEGKPRDFHPHLFFCEQRFAQNHASTRCILSFDISAAVFLFLISPNPALFAFIHFFRVLPERSFRFQTAL